jgi:hypothetical protein
MNETQILEMVIALYEQIRHNHERAVSLTNSVTALVDAMERTNKKFQLKYAASFEEATQSSRAEADALALLVIDGNILRLRQQLEMLESESDDHEET